MGIYLNCSRIKPKESLPAEPDWWEYKAYERMAFGEIDHREQIDHFGERYFRPKHFPFWRDKVQQDFENEDYWLKVLDFLENDASLYLYYG